MSVKVDRSPQQVSGSALPVASGDHLRVVHLIPYMHPMAGGPPVVVDRWVTALRHLGCTVDVITTDGYGSGDMSWVDQYAKNYPIHVGRKIGPNGFGYSRDMKAKLRELLPDADVVHAHNLWGYANQLVSRYCPRYNVPFVVSTHGMLDPNSMSRKSLKKRLYGNLLEWPALRKSKGLLFTHEEEDRLARESADRLPRGHVVPLGTDPPTSDDTAALKEKFLERFPQLVNCDVILFLGRLHEKKGLDLLIPAFARLAGDHEDARLLLVGPGKTNYVDSIHQAVKKAGISDRVLLTGPLHGDEKWGAFAAAKMFVLPSYQENFAISAVEAMRSGTPVVVSQRVNIWQDLVSAGAAYATELDEDDLHQQMQSLMYDQAAGAEMGRRGRELAINNYSWERSAEQLLDVYHHVIAHSSAVS